MKKLIALASATLLLLLPLGAVEVKIATVAMDKLYDGYYKVQEGNKQLQSATEKAQEQAQVFIKEGQALVEERNKFVEDMDNPALSDEAKKDIRTKIGESDKLIQSKQAEFQQWLKENQSVLQQRQLTFRQERLEEIKKVVQAEAVKAGATLVVDTADVVGSGVPPVLYADPAWDITQQVLTELNKDKPNN